MDVVSGFSRTRVRRLAIAFFLWLGTPVVPAAPQTPAPDRPGPYVVDIRGASGSIPHDATYFPPVPFSTILPSRGLGLDVGAHIYLNQLGPARVGLGVSLLRAHGSSSPPAPPRTTGVTTAATTAAQPDINATFTTLAPQVSFNFGSAAGWSYISVGIGRARMKTEASAFTPAATGDNPAVPVPARLADSGDLSSINVGGGARWFAKRRLAFTFDLRFHLVSGNAATETLPRAPRTTLIVASAGMGLR